MDYSDYQLAIFDEVKRGHKGGNVAINAVAGSGKTTTSVDSLQHIPLIYSVQFNAFGRDIAAEMQKRVTRRGTRVSTYNSFGWQIALRNSITKPLFEENKTEQILQHMVLHAHESDPTSWARFQSMKYNIKRLVSMLKGQCVYTVEEASKKLPELIAHHAIEVDDRQFDQVLLETYHHAIENCAIYDYDDQIFQPLYRDMLIPRSDFVIVDEFQDTNRMQAELMKRASEGGRFFCVGDPDQSIFGFRGTTPDAFGEFIHEFNARQMPLSICYRCPKAVVREAKQIVPRIEHAPFAREGVVDNVSTADFKQRVRPGDYVLCRTIAPLVKRCLENIRDGVPARVLGRDIGDDLQYIIDKVTNRSYFVPITTFRDLLGEFVARKMQSYNQLGMTALAITLHDKYDTLMSLAVDCQTVSDVIKRMNQVFVKDGNINLIQYMSIHKSKGLECDNDVWVLRPDFLPHPRSNGIQWMMEEERRLKYVAITRTKRGLFWVQKEPNEK